MEELTTQVNALVPLMWNTVKAVVFLVGGYIVAGIVQRTIRHRVYASEYLDNTLGGFFASIAKWLILAVVVIAVLQLFGFQVTSLVAVLGAATLAIGLALQGTLSNIAAGVMLIIFRPFKIGNYVDIAGTSGTVKDLNLFITELATPDNVQIIVPNGKVWGEIITNYSAHDLRRLDMTFGIDYDDSAEKAVDVILDCAAKDERVLREPEPWVRVVNLNSSSVDIGVRFWCRSADYWELKFALTKTIKEAFDANDITIPYPHQVEIHKSA